MECSALLSVDDLQFVARLPRGNAGHSTAAPHRRTAEIIRNLVDTRAGPDRQVQLSGYSKGSKPGKNAASWVLV